MNRPSKEQYLVILLGFIVISSGLDLAHDLSEGIALDHILKELLVVALSVTAIGWLLSGLGKQRRQISALKQELGNAKMSAQSATEEVLVSRRQLSQTIAKQFAHWNLSRSEQEIAWLLLKGLSLKEISALRNTAEKTVRQQASAIYQKADVNGRHAFSAWFIEDLL